MLRQVSRAPMRKHVQMSSDESLCFQVLSVSDCLSDALAFRNLNRVTQRDEAYMRWRYLERPSEVPAYVVWAFIGDARVGAATVAPHDFSIEGRPVRLGVVGDISVDVRTRGRGVARELLAFIKNVAGDRISGCLVMPNVPVVPALVGTGWCELGKVRRSVRVLRPAQVGTGVARRLAAAGVVVCQRAMDRVSRSPRYRGLSGGSPDDVQGVWDRCLLGNFSLGNRSAEYIGWRFASHPADRYEILIVKMGEETVGYGAVRTSGAQVWIDDVLAVDEAAGQAMGRHIVDWAMDNSAIEQIHVRCLNCVPPGVPWERLGFTGRSDSQSVFISTDTVTDQQGWQRSVRDSRWYATAGDKDV